MNPLVSVDSLKKRNVCPRCGGAGIDGRKCSQCAKEIAAQVTQDFKANIGHEFSEAILSTKNENLISTVVKENKLIENKES